jgi:hypothetical protein
MIRKTIRRQVLTAIVAVTASAPTIADDFPKLDGAGPQSIDAAWEILTTSPRFDYGDNSCLPGTGISRDGQQNRGLKIAGDITGECRDNWQATSNTFHRFVCKDSGGDRYCAHAYALYFEKDQVTWNTGGHKHDWEHAIVYTKNGNMTHTAVSAHGDMYTYHKNDFKQDYYGHPLIVYRKDCRGAFTTHAFVHHEEFDGLCTTVPGGVGWNIPTLVSWWTMTGDTVTNNVMRGRFNQWGWGSANMPINDYNFLGNVLDDLPGGYPTFNNWDVYVSR